MFQAVSNRGYGWRCVDWIITAIISIIMFLSVYLGLSATNALSELLKCMYHLQKGEFYRIMLLTASVNLTDELAVM